MAKPYLKYLTTVDFGRMTYHNEFEQLLESHNLTITYKHRVQSTFNVLLKCFKFYVFEAEPKGQQLQQGQGESAKQGG